jgi:hypothetical protein
VNADGLPIAQSIIANPHVEVTLRFEMIDTITGVLVECTSCHTSMSINSVTAVSGPHGMHPVGAAWANGHGGLIESGSLNGTQCRACHGVDGRGKVLSRMQAKRTLATKDNKFGTKHYWRGQRASCFDCHNGPDSGDPVPNTPPVVTSLSTNTANRLPVTIPLSGSDANGHALSFRIVHQPEHGTVSLSNSTATYFPEAGFVGSESFTFCAWDGRSDSNLGTGTVAVAQGPFSLKVSAHVPTTYSADWPAPFCALTTVSNVNAVATHLWSFGDATSSTSVATEHAYAMPGDYEWKLVSQVTDGIATVAVTNQGVITITAKLELSWQLNEGTASLTWPSGPANAYVEQTAKLEQNTQWTPATNAVLASPSGWKLPISADGPQQFFRLHQAR